MFDEMAVTTRTMLCNGRWGGTFKEISHASLSLPSNFSSSQIVVLFHNAKPIAQERSAS